MLVVCLFGNMSLITDIICLVFPSSVQRVYCGSFVHRTKALSGEFHSDVLTSVAISVRKKVLPALQTAISVG